MLQGLLDQVKRAIFNDPHNPYQEGSDPGGLINQIEGFFGRHQAEQGTMQNPLPASQDPYGDPADLPNQGGGYAYADNNRFGNVRPASEDPYGDPADQFPDQGSGARGPQQGDLQQQFPGIRPASQDPYGDPADQEGRR